LGSGAGPEAQHDRQDGGSTTGNYSFVPDGAPKDCRACWDWWDVDSGSIKRWTPTRAAGQRARLLRQSWFASFYLVVTLKNHFAELDAHNYHFGVGEG